MCTVSDCQETKGIKPPEYLKGEKQIEKFHHFAALLESVGLFSELEADCLARYIMSEQLYLQYTAQLTRLIKDNDVESIKTIQALQDRAFSQCQKCAKDLGLNMLL